MILPGRTKQPNKSCAAGDDSHSQGMLAGAKKHRGKVDLGRT